MPALLTTGLASDPLTTLQGIGSASPTRSSLDKSNRFRPVYSLFSDTSPSNCSTTIYSVLEARCSTTFLTHSHADRRQPSVAVHQSESTGDRDRPAAQPAARRGNCVRRAERAERVTSSRRSCQRASAASSPERPPSAPRRSHGIEQPSEGLAPRNGRASAMGDRREPLRGGAVSFGAVRGGRRDF
jgi:hypothetical protein